MDGLPVVHASYYLGPDKMEASLDSGVKNLNQTDFYKVPAIVFCLGQPKALERLLGWI
jgi:hypothetical protein